MAACERRLGVWGAATLHLYKDISLRCGSRRFARCIAKLPQSFAGAIIRMQTEGSWFETFSCEGRAGVTEGGLWDCAIAGLKSGKRRLPGQTGTEMFRRCISRGRA